MEKTQYIAVITDVKVIGPYTLLITFEDGSAQTINFEPVLYGHSYGPLRDLALFNQVRVDEDFHTLVWPNDADFDPMTLYNWHSGAGDELIRRARTWQSSAIESRVALQAAIE